MTDQFDDFSHDDDHGPTDKTDQESDGSGRYLVLGELFTALFAKSRVAMMCIDTKQRIVFENSAAGQILAGATVLKRDRGRAVPLCGDTARLLRRVIHVLKHDAEWTGIACPERETVLRSPNDEARLCARLVMLSGAHIKAIMPTHSATIAMTLCDPRARPDVEIEVLSSVFGLTPKEARVMAASAKGFGVAEIADLTCRSPETVRSHIKSIHTKINARKQSDLVRMVFNVLLSRAVPCFHAEAWGSPGPLSPRRGRRSN
ncbi:MAG: helix-turn-helix transcriptional regulator [Pseudomonadota bacterium]